MPITTDVKTFAIKMLRELGEPITAGSLTQIVEWLYECMIDISNRSGSVNFSRSTGDLTTVASTSQYTLAYKQVTNIQDIESGISLEHRSEQWLLDRGLKLDSEGTPRIFFPIGFSAGNGMIIQLWPVPSAAKTYKVIVSLDQAELSLSDTFPLPVAWYPVVKLFIRYKYWDDLVADSAEEASVTGGKALNNFGMYEQKLKDLTVRLSYSGATRYNNAYSDVPTSNIPPGPQWPDNYPR